MCAAGFLALVVFGAVEGASDWWLGLAPALLVGGWIVYAVGVDLTKLQEKRQLSRPPLLGDWATGGDGGTVILLIFLGGCVCLPLALWCAVGWGTALPGLLTGGMATCAVFVPLEEAQKAAADRAALRTRTGWLRLRMGDAEGAAARLGEAQAELQRAVGTGEVHRSWVAAAAQVRALCEAGRDEEAAAVRVRLDDAAGAGEFWQLLRAGAAAAVRSLDGEVLGLLEAAALGGCWVPAGSRPVDNDGATEGGLREWEFLGRMARAADDVEASASSVEDWRRWQAYRDLTVHLARKVANMDTHGLTNAMESRGLPGELESGESDAAKRARLLGRLFEPPAWAYEHGVAVAAETAGAALYGAWGGMAAAALVVCRLGAGGREGG